MNLKTATPVEIDTQIAAIWGPKQAMFSRIAAVANSISKYGKAPQYLLDEQAALKAEYEATKAVAEPFEAEYRSRPWSRFFTVPDGHVHREHCKTLRWSTLRFWMPEDSGKDEAATVLKYAAVACTVCFPSAPVEAREAAEAARKTRIATDKAERAAKKLADTKAKLEREIARLQKSIAKQLATSKTPGETDWSLMDYDARGAELNRQEIAQVEKRLARLATK